MVKSNQPAENCGLIAYNRLSLTLIENHPIDNHVNR